MSIRLRDEIAHLKAYTSFPKPLYKEVKEYTNELLVKGWIVVSYNDCSTVIKREIFCKKVRYGGLLVFADGVRMNPKDVVAVQALIQKTPQNKGDVRDVLLGFGI